MKYIKKYESDIEDSIKKSNEDMAKKGLDYKFFYDKYVILKYQHDYYLAKFIEIDTSNNRVSLEIYFWISDISDFDIKLINILTINEICVVSSYDNVDDAKKAYLFILDTKKFNL